MIFIASGLGKLLSQAESFKAIFNPFPDFLSPIFTEAVFSWLPVIELIVGLLLIIGVVVKPMAVFSSLLIAGFIAKNIWLLNHGQGQQPCYCFGIMEEMLNATLSTVGSLYLDTVMLVLVLIILFCYPSKFLNIYPWFLRRGEID